MDEPEREIVYSDDADRDIEEIAEHLQAAAGFDVAERYLGDIVRSISGLQDNPSLGQQADRVKRDLRRLVCRNHMIYYRVREAVEIVRILDTRRDHARLL